MKARFLALAALVLGLASCQTEPEGLNVNVGGEVDTTITVTIPDTETRYGAESNSAKSVFENGVLSGDATMRYIFQVYYNNNGEVVESQAVPQVKYSDDKTVNFDVRLVPGRNYTFVVWADVVDGENAGDKHYITRNDEDKINLRNITVNERSWDAMDESRDAFTVTEVIEQYNGQMGINLKLKRPHAKLRVITTDMEALNDLQITPTKATVEYTTEHYTTFDAVAGAVKEGTKTMRKAHTEFPIAAYGDNVDDQSMVLFTDYFFATEEDEEIVNFSLKVYDQFGVAEVNKIKFNNFNTSIPAQRNYLTTIMGNVLTDGNDIDVIVKDAFENANNSTDEPYYIEIWDGVTTKQPAYDEATKTYTVKRGSELAWIAATVNGTTRATDAFNGMTIVLAYDINLGGNEWTPIGTGVKFQGSFDGQGHTIKGLKVTERHGDAQAALFGSIAGTSEFKNVVIDEACIKYPANGKDYYAAAIVGTLYGTHVFENITVKNSTITGNNKVGAIFAHDGSSTQITIDNCHVDNCYIASEDTADGGCVGGLIGYYATGREGKPNTISNSSVKNSTIVGINSTNSGKRANSEFIGSILTNDAMVLNIVDCVVENNEFSQTTDGVNPVSYVGVFNTKFIGGDRAEENKGKVVINGYETVAQGLGVNEENDYLVTSTEGLTYLAEEVNSGNNEVANSDIILDGDIDLSSFIMTRSAVRNNWTPIGTEANPYQGTFDGNNCTIKNLALVEEVAKEGKAYIGFFGYAKNATIKNVTFENVYINIPCLDIDHSQGHIGAVAGSLEGTSTIENVTVKGDITVYTTQTANGASRVAVVAGGNAYGDVTMKNVHVVANEGSSLIANNNVGALAGQLQGKMVFENCSSNINVTANKFFAGGLVGIAAGDSYIKNCHTTGNVSVVAGREGRHNDEYRVGGIAGGWADGKTKVFTLEGCAYSGKLYGANADGAVVENFDYAGYVGRGYTLSNCAGSTVIIDGMKYVQVRDDVYGKYYYTGAIMDIAGVKAVVFQVENGFKAVSLEQKDLNSLYWQDAMDWATGLGQGWSLASIYDLDDIHAARKVINAALTADDANNTLFVENINGSNACYLSSTMAPYGESDANGNAYFANRAFFKRFNANGYWDVPYSSFDCINIYTPLKSNYVARAVYSLGMYNIGDIVTVGGQKAIVYSITEDGAKAVSVEQGGEMTWDESMAWAEGLGSGWSLASLEDMQAIYGVRFALNRALAADNANNVLFEEDNKEDNGSYADYWTSTLVEGTSSTPKAYYFRFDATGREFTNRTMFPVEYSRAVYTIK